MGTPYPNPPRRAPRPEATPAVHTPGRRRRARRVGSCLGLVGGFFLGRRLAEGILNINDYQ